MVSNKNLKEYEFSSIDQYFDYIVSSRMNGNYKQTDTLIIELSKEQKKDFITYLDSFYGVISEDESVKYCRKTAFNLI